MARLLICTAVFFLNFFFAANAITGELESLERENALLKTELKLARKQNIYFVFDLGKKIVYLKAKGATFREFPVGGTGFWGTPISTEPYKLLKRTALMSPEREEIKPGEKEEADNFELHALELKDMPRNFKLMLDEGMVLYVRTENNGLLPFLRKNLFLHRWRFLQPIFTVWNSIHKKPYSAIYIMLKEEDAKSLYWSIYEGVETIIYPFEK